MELTREQLKREMFEHLRCEKNSLRRNNSGDSCNCQSSKIVKSSHC